jgi:hypothetical protein
LVTPLFAFICQQVKLVSQRNVIRLDRFRKVEQLGHSTREGLFPGVESRQVLTAIQVTDSNDIGIGTRISEQRVRDNPPMHNQRSLYTRHVNQRDRTAMVSQLDHPVLARVPATLDSRIRGTLCMQISSLVVESGH